MIETLPEELPIIICFVLIILRLYGSCYFAMGNINFNLVRRGIVCEVEARMDAKYSE